jgi:anti-sigma regulatory factor (Ser/Thr protein kinase)
MTRIKLKIILPKIPDIELVAIEGLNQMAKFFGISDDKIGEARILVAEAIINAFEYAAESDKGIRVEYSMNKKKLTILVRDYGKGFNPESIAEPDIQKKLGSDNKRGWGLKLMKSMSDDFHINSGASGTKITIMKKLG